MPQIPLDFLDLLIDSPGDLIFFLLVFGLSQAILFLAFGLRSRLETEQATYRYVVAAIALVSIWLILMAVALFSLLSSFEASMFMPPLERLGMSLSLVFISWAFLSAENSQRGARANLWLSGTIVLILLLYLYTASDWFGEFETGAMFNMSELAPIWSILPFAIGLLGFFAVVFSLRRIADAPLKCLFFILIVLGNGWDVWQFADSELSGSYLGSARWAYLAALALAPVVIHRLMIASLDRRLAEGEAPSSERPIEDESVVPREQEIARGTSAEPVMPTRPAEAAVALENRQLLRAFGMMMNTREESGIPQQVVATALELLDAEVCLLLRMEDEVYAKVIAGQDNVNGQSFDGISLSLDSHPTIVDARLSREQRTLVADQENQEVEALFSVLKIGATGTVYIQPISLEDEVLAVLLAAMPYRQGEFSREQRALLDDIGQMAGYILAWSFDAEAATLLAEEQTIKSIVDPIASQGEDRAIRDEARRGLEASLQENTGQITKLRIQIADLRAQAHDERITLLSRVTDSDDGLALSQGITILFDEHTQLMERRDAESRQVLDAETVLQICTAESDDSLAQVIRECAHKTHNLLLNTSVRLRDLVNRLRAQNETIDSIDPEAILEPLAGEVRQLELEREQLQRRLAAIASKLRMLGVEAEMTSMTQVLIQLYAERRASKRQAAAAQHERDILARERAKLADGNGSKTDDLRNQLKRLSADHESLMNLREEMRRDYQDLLDRFESRDEDNRALQQRIRDLQSQLEIGGEKRSDLERNIAELSGERENLLRIRDQLTARLADSLPVSTAASGEPALRARLQELQDTVSTLNEQREKLALELSDAKTALAASNLGQAERTEPSEEATAASRLVEVEQTLELVRQMQAPVSAISDCTDILLKESIGILGAAQLAVLQRVSVNLGRLTALLADLMKLDHDEHDRFVLSYAETDIVDLLDEAITLLSTDIRKKQLALELSVDDGLPKITVDSSCIKQVLRHLLQNACDVSDEGAPLLITAALASTRSPANEQPVEAIRISIEDKGGGISTKDLPRVFARKYLHENPKIQGLSDTGVGMTVARAFARAHAGDLWIDSKAGEGSVFHLDLPTRLMASVEE
ncbi:MAG: ATP-binding protein [Chloroflexi bacterium]|nr:ATP-binding protein [Chloroflexota bacterium]